MAKQTQVLIEVVKANVGIAQQVSQVGIEVVKRKTPAIRVSQVLVEVIRKNDQHYYTDTAADYTNAS